MSKYPHLEQAENEVFKSFWGRVPISWATSLLRMRNGSTSHELIHRIKYRNDRDLALFLGRKLGAALKASAHLDNVDLVLPMPLHPKRMRQRGFNQSERIAIGVSEMLEAPLLNQAVSRIVHLSSQTGKSRRERSQGLLHAFCCTQPELLTSRHVLLVDDVITSGATMEGLANCLLEVAGIRLSICSVAYAD